ncbi:hypothetical protein PybrP1_002864 [[Pythium] brassicae (nom. inval.)]|nr:hypothetical protein PybrP1_002864 [[Pythium] brassicae (nom. inval.)]
MWRPALFLAVLSALARPVRAADSSGTLPPWLAYVTGGLLVFIIIYYCCRRARFDENLQQPLLGGQYTEDGQPMTRQDVQDSTDELNSQWKCDVCDFHNKDSSKSCVLCGTERGFSLGLSSPSTRGPSVGTEVTRERSFNRTRSFAIRRLNMLNARQRGARNRQDWVRKVGLDGKRYWAKKESPFTAPGSVDKAADKAARSTATDGTSLSSATSSPDGAASAVAIDMPPSGDMAADTLASPPPAVVTVRASMNAGSSSNHNDKELVTQASLAFVSQLAQTPRHPEGRMTFKEYREVDARVASRGYEISEQDLEILEQTIGLFMCAHVDSLAYVINPNSGSS